MPATINNVQAIIMFFMTKVRFLRSRRDIMFIAHRSIRDSGAPLGAQSYALGETATHLAPNGARKSWNDLVYKHLAPLEQRANVPVSGYKII